jgi:hypothetical protein
VLGLGSSSAHRLPKKQQIDRSRLMHLSSCKVAFGQITGRRMQAFQNGVEDLSTCTAFGAAPIDPCRDSV